MVKKISKFVFAIIILSVAQPAQAQIIDMTGYVNWFSPIAAQTFDNLIYDSINGKSKKTSRITLPAKNPSKLVFQTSSIVRRRNLTQFVNRIRQNDPLGAAQMEQLFASQDVIDLISQSIAKKGLKSNNVADAYAVYWTNAWLGSRGRDENLSKAQMIAVRNQAAKALLSTQSFTSATDAQKQEIAEAMLIQAALIAISINSAKSDPAQLSLVQKAITQGARAMGLDLDRMTLTPQGFRPVNN